MSTRREVAIALLGLPAVASVASSSGKAHFFSEATARIISYTLYAEARG